MQCEHCNEELQEMYLSHSMLIVLQKVDRNGYSWFQCDDGSLVDNHTFQHWHCSKQHMLSGVEICINEHYNEEKLTPPPYPVSIHKHVLNTGVECKYCKDALIEKAYRFCLTVATPINYVPDESHNIVGEWCCSLDHARLQAIENLKNV